jgi:hypothetical protein
MPTIREKVFIGASSAALAIGVAAMLQPPAHEDTQSRQAQQQQQDIENLSEAEEREREHRRAAGQAHGEAENLRRLTPGEYDPRPRVRIRIP